jgi:hypothetical protein
MRVLTVTRDARPFAVLRARDEDEAVRLASALGELPADAASRAERLQAREPTDAEMIGWLIRRDDHLLPIAET